jgi:hypothetical protein
MTTLLLALTLLLDDGISPFPMTPAVPQVNPQPTPVADEPHPIGTVRREEFYILQSESPLLVVASPLGLVEITHEQGPMMARGKFAGGDGTTETRMLLGNHLYFVDAIKSGSVELIVIPAGAADADQIQRQLVEVQAGPRPPPDVEPSPDDSAVVPIPSPDELRVVLLIDETANEQQLLAVNSLDTRIWLDSNCEAWQRWDRSAVEADGVDGAPPEFAKLWRDIGDDIPPGPQVLIAGGTSVQVRPIVDAATLLDDLGRARGQK